MTQVEKVIERINKKERLSKIPKEKSIKKHPREYLGLQIMERASEAPCERTSEPFNPDNINWNDTKEYWYREFYIPKRSGGKRKIEAPQEELKVFQRKILLPMIRRIFKFSTSCYGGLRYKNITQAAQKHVKNRYKVKMDISNFYPSITEDMIKEYLTLNHPRMSKRQRERLAYLVTNKDGVLPQGAPTSPYVSAAVTAKLHNTLVKIARGKGMKYTVYVDDIVISGDDKDELDKMAWLVEKLCKKNKLTMNAKKKKLMVNKQEVLGLCCTTDKPHPRLPRKKRYIIKAMLHNMKKKLDNGEKLSYSELCKAQGNVGFAIMAKDQWAEKFKSQLNELIARNQKS